MILESRSVLQAVLLASLLAALPVSAALSVSISPQASFYLDANQSSVNFTANAIGGIPFGPQHNSYTYQWSVQKNTTCPGYASIYAHYGQTLYYAPNGTTNDCIFSVQVSDYTGNSTSSVTRQLVVNPQLQSPGSIGRGAYTIYSSQNSTVSVNALVGGTPPYHYQWLASGGIGASLTASTANSICPTTSGTPDCVFAANSSTAPGLYSFQLQYWDSASTPTVLTSNIAVVRVGPSKNQSIGAVKSTTTLNSSTTSTSASTSVSSSATTTVAQSVPASPLVSAENTAVGAARQIENWIKDLIRYVV
jgi:hypothetical protein